MEEQLLADLNSASEFFERSTRSLTEEDSTYTPAKGIFTAAQQVAHAAQTIVCFMARAFRPGGFDLDFEAHERAAREVSSLAEARRLVHPSRGERSVGHQAHSRRGVGLTARGCAGHGWGRREPPSWCHHRSHTSPSRRTDHLRAAEEQGSFDALYGSPGVGRPDLLRQAGLELKRAAQMRRGEDARDSSDRIKVGESVVVDRGLAS